MDYGLREILFGGFEAGVKVVVGGICGCIWRGYWVRIRGVKSFIPLPEEAQTGQ